MLMLTNEEMAKLVDWARNEHYKRLEEIEAIEDTKTLMDKKFQEYARFSGFCDTYFKLEEMNEGVEI